jgi:hypothetical protein
MKNETAYPPPGMDVFRPESVVDTNLSKVISYIGNLLTVLAICDVVHRKYDSLSDLLQAIKVSN